MDVTYTDLALAIIEDTLEYPLSPSDLTIVLETVKNSPGFGDVEGVHMAADAILCNQLTALGFEKAVAVYDEIEKWYS